MKGDPVQSIICFTSDFGSGDTWVGVCHAVIYRACPQARVVDLGHNVAPFDIRKAASVAASGVYQLPDAIHLVVVDPGVGGGRRDLIVVTTAGVLLVGPDNGVLIPAARRGGGVKEAYSIIPEQLNFREPLATFHARDVLAPAAAALACGVEPSHIGEPVDPESLVDGPFAAGRLEGGAYIAEAIDTDRFGSVRFGLSAETIKTLSGTATKVRLSVGHLELIVPFGHTFSDVPEGDPITLVDSSGWFTLAVRIGSAAERYGIESGMVATIRFSD